MTLIERVLPDGSRLTFEQRDTGYRAYKLWTLGQKPVRLPSVSTVLGCLEKRALYAWHEAKGAAGALAAVRMGELDPAIHHDDEAIEVVRALDLGAEAAMKKAQKRGLDIHEALQHYCETSAWPDTRDMDPEHRPYLPGLASALLKLDPEPIAVEQVTCSKSCGIAGRFDLLAHIEGQVTLMDLKTSKLGVLFDESHLQVAAYAACEQECSGVLIDRCLVLGVGPDGSFKADESCATFDDFRGVLAAYRARQRLSRARADVRRMEEAAA